MELGEKIRQARLEAGLSQRQLCGEIITRNMLSLIENGAAKPSLSTLSALASRLNKPLSYFVEENAAVSANQNCMTQAWACYEERNYTGCAQSLKTYLQPDPVYDREWRLLTSLNTLSLAEAAVRDGRWIQARKLLHQAEDLEKSLFWLPELKNRRMCILGKLRETVREEDLPDVDDELMLHARAALKRGKYGDAGRYLDAMQLRSTPEWNYLRGKTAFGQGNFGAAIPFLKSAELGFPKEVIPMLEDCYRELGDYKNAYFYARKHR